MKTLPQLAQENPSWSLDEFVQATNELLPQYLPVQKGNTRVREEITPRLVRHYATQGMLDEPLKEGREARYTYRHLLQILVVRRLQAEGCGAIAINDLAKSKNNADLESLLQGGVQLNVAPANPALAFLQQIKQRQVSPASPTPPDRAIKPATRWTRIEILPGLEIHLREDFIYPSSPQEQQNLLQYIAQKLKSDRQS